MAAIEEKATKAIMSTQDTLLVYSEWLDSQGLVVGDKSVRPGGSVDPRSHEELAQQFVKEWESNEDRSLLAGRLTGQIAEVLSEAAKEMSAAMDGVAAKMRNSS